MFFFDHLSLGVADLARAATFYDAALSALGHVRLAQNARSVCYGPPGYAGEAPFAIIAHGPDARAPGAGFHLAFRAPDRAAVDAFHAAALAAGARDLGAPGLRPMYHPNYYGAFVLDLDGNNLEAVCHKG